MTRKFQNQDNVTSAAIHPAIEDTIKKLISTLLPSIESHVTNDSFDYQKDGLDFLEVKNGIMLSYLIDLTQLIRVQSSSSMKGANDCLKPCIDRLRTMKIALDKMRPLEKKLRYSLDKLLALSATSSTFAAGEGPSVNLVNGEDRIENKEESDPLSYRPNPDRLIDDGDGDFSDSASNDNDHEDSDDEDQNSIRSDPDESVDNDSELKAAKTALNSGRLKSAKKRKEADDPASSNEGQLYRAPRLVAVPFTEREKKSAREEHLLKKERNRMLKSELLSTLRSSYGEAPEEEDFGGGATLGKQREAAQRLSDRDRERTEFEENTMMRLTTSRKEKKMRNKIMRDEVSNLNAIADLSNLTAGVSAAFGDSKQHSSRGGFKHQDEKAQRHSNGKRRRVDDGESHGTGQRNSTKKNRQGAKNSFQRALYGMGDGGGKGKKSNKRKG